MVVEASAPVLWVVVCHQFALFTQRLNVLGLRLARLQELRISLVGSGQGIVRLEDSFGLVRLGVVVVEQLLPLGNIQLLADPGRCVFVVDH